MPLFRSVKQYTSRLLQSPSVSDDRVSVPRRIMNVQFGLWTRDLVCVSPSKDVCANVGANIFVFVVISSQKWQLKMRSCKNNFWGEF